MPVMHVGTVKMGANRNIRILADVEANPSLTAVQLLVHYETRTLQVWSASTGHGQCVYHAGENGRLPAAEAAELIAQGFATAT